MLQCKTSKFQQLNETPNGDIFAVLNHAEFRTIGFQSQFEVPPTSGYQVLVATYATFCG
jgi:hypothetical protein